MDAKFQRNWTTGILVFAAVVIILGILLQEGVPRGTVLLLGLLAICPLSMLGIHGGGQQHAGTSSQPEPVVRSIDRDQRPSVDAHTHRVA